MVAEHLMSNERCIRVPSGMSPESLFEHDELSRAHDRYMPGDTGFVDDDVRVGTLGVAGAVGGFGSLLVE